MARTSREKITSLAPEGERAGVRGKHSSGAPRKPNAIQALLESRGLAARKIFGQNFMADSNFAAAIARDARLDERTLAIEAGPGTGLLTRAMFDSHPHARVLAIEIDRGLAALLRETFAAEIAARRLTLLEGDALDGKRRINAGLCAEADRISRDENRPRKIVCANLPYNIATPLIANLAVDEQNLNVSEVFATIQLELAERLLASPGSASYGALSVFIALRAKGKIIRRAGPEIFWPRPKVDSAVIALEFKPFESALPRGEAGAFQEFLKSVFSQRRKTLRALLKPRALPLVEGISTDARAEELAPAQLLALFRTLEFE